MRPILLASTLRARQTWHHALSHPSLNTDSNPDLLVPVAWSCSCLVVTCTAAAAAVKHTVLVDGTLQGRSRTMEMQRALVAPEAGLWLLLNLEGSLAGTDVQSCTLVSHQTPRISLVLLTLSTARAMYSYAAAIPEELGFTKGDVLSVLRLQDDGWWEAEIASAPRRTGLVPSNYLQII